MIKTHEINLSTSIYNTLLNTNSAIIQDDEKKITENDYVLFKQVEIIDEKELVKLLRENEVFNYQYDYQYMDNL